MLNNFVGSILIVVLEFLREKWSWDGLIDDSYEIFNREEPGKIVLLDRIQGSDFPLLFLTQPLESVERIFLVFYFAAF